MLHVRLTPGASRDALEGLERLADGREVLKARVRAVPEDGKANVALAKLLARELSVPASRVTLEAGATGRVKRLFVAGTAAELLARLKALTAP